MTRVRRGSRAATTRTGDPRTDEIQTLLERLGREIAPDELEDWVDPVLERLCELNLDVARELEESALDEYRDLRNVVADYLRGVASGAELQLALDDSGYDPLRLIA